MTWQVSTTISFLSFILNMSSTPMLPLPGSPLSDRSHGLWSR